MSRKQRNKVNVPAVSIDFQDTANLRNNIA